LEIHDLGYLSQYGDLGLLFFIPGARWLRWVGAQQLECWRFRAAFFTTPRRAIDCAVGPILSIYAEISGSVEINRE
jgi:hypothetical protein